MKRPNTPCVLLILTLSLAVGCCHCPPQPVPPPGPPEKYAVLASTEMATEDHVKSNSDFWYDLVMTYCTLIENGFSGDNIFVLYGEGVDFQSKVPQYKMPYCSGSVTSPITDIPMKNSSDIAKDNLCSVLCCLSTGHPAKLSNGNCKCKTGGGTGAGDFLCTDYAIPELGPNDFLFSWMKGHGNTENCQTSLLLKAGKTLRDSEVKNLIKNLQPARRTMIFETCDAGGWLDDLKNANTSVLVSVGKPDSADGCKESSWAATYPEINEDTGAIEPMIHGRFSHSVNAALRQADMANSPVDSDQDSNNLVSVDEGFVTAELQIRSENSATDPDLIADYGGKMQPALELGDGIAPCLFIRLPVPGADDNVFSMDHPKDDATVPTKVSDNSPDLWIRQSEGGEGHEPVKLNSVNHIYARVHNIGCANPDVVVNFYWATESTPDAWNPIGSADVPSPQIGDATLAHFAWQLNTELDPAIGPYWIIAELSAGDDTPNGNPLISDDDNKVRIKTDVVP